GASVKVFDDDINKLRTIQQVLGQGLFTSTFHPNVLQNAFRSADVVIGAKCFINMRRRYIIAEDMVRMMKRGALLIDLRVNQGGSFETTCGLSASEPAVFEQYGVLHYCKPNVSNFVARTTSMALSNIFVPLFFKIGDMGGVQAMIQCDTGFKKGVYMYTGKPVNDYVSARFNLPSNNIDIYLAAF
ncbi:MAG: alanine dehydrogenase, partial [Parabacteroides sp.]|nr:alanine dehydrogenase [Parabacteroides sp.]